jgi:hypothetical protein
MQFFKKIIPGLVFLQALNISAQKPIAVALPDIKITADQLLSGNADTYGRGDWQAQFTAVLVGTELHIDGKILFSEKSHDFTVLAGAFHTKIAFDTLKYCRGCLISTNQTSGSVGGINIGARGYRWFEGQGLVSRAKIQTDVFGDDLGRIGGTVQFNTFYIFVNCPLAEATELSPLKKDISTVEP